MKWEEATKQIIIAILFITGGIVSTNHGIWAEFVIPFAIYLLGYELWSHWFTLK